MLGFINIILAVLNKVSDPHDKYHMFDTIPAYIMLVVRFLTLCVFIYGSISSIVKLQPDETKLRTYFYHLIWLGILYLGFLPVCFGLIEFI